MNKLAESPIIGIDLGTTNSLVAVVQGGRPVILTGPLGERMLPSVVRYFADRVELGRRSISGEKGGGNEIFSAKRLIGKSYDSIEEMVKKLPYRVIPKDETKKGVVVQIGEMQLEPAQVSAEILSELKRWAELRLGQSVSKAVITVPAYFNDSQRQATRLAASLANLQVVRLLNEPTAASLAYGITREQSGVVAVYDLGGGTFDISILKIERGVFEVLATGGDTDLGGDDFDRVIADELARRCELAAVEFEERSWLKSEAEKIKMRLSDTMEFEWNGQWSGRSFQSRWTRSDLNERLRPWIERTLKTCQQAVLDSGLPLEAIETVVLVGGSTRMPSVREAVSEFFKRPVRTEVDPDEAVALGAAIQADILQGKNREILLLDVASLSLGIETYGGVMSVLIPRNSKIPISAKEVFTTFVDNQTGVDIHVLQGERDRVEGNRSLARFKLRGIQPSPAGMPRIEVQFMIDADGLLEVAARDLRSGKAHTIEVNPSVGLDEGEVNRLLEERNRNLQGDQVYRNWVNAKNEAEALVRSTEKNLPVAEEMLPPDEVQAIRLQLGRLKDIFKEAVSNRDERRWVGLAQEVRAATFILDRMTKKLADLMVKQAIKKALQQSSEV